MTKARCRTDRRQLALAHTHDSLSTPTTHHGARGPQWQMTTCRWTGAANSHLVGCVCTAPADVTDVSCDAVFRASRYGHHRVLREPGEVLGPLAVVELGDGSQVWQPPRALSSSSLPTRRR